MSSDFATIADEPSDWSTYDELEALKRAEAKQKKKAAEIATITKEEDKNKDYRGMYEFAHFICGNVVIPREDEGSIQIHKRWCPRCIDRENFKRQIKNEALEAAQTLRGNMIIYESTKKVLNRYVINGDSKKVLEGYSLDAVKKWKREAEEKMKESKIEIDKEIAG